VAEVYVLWCWTDMHRDECSGFVDHALATFPRRMQKAPDPQRVIPLCPVPIPLRVWARIAPSFRYYGDYKHLSALGEYPQSRISIHRCYKRYRGGAERGRLEGAFQGYRGRAMQDLGYELPRIPIPRTRVNRPWALL
jgi:hypothetical protein